MAAFLAVDIISNKTRFGLIKIKIFSANSERFCIFNSQAFTVEKIVSSPNFQEGV